MPAPYLGNSQGIKTSCERVGAWLGEVSNAAKAAGEAPGSTSVEDGSLKVAESNGTSSASPVSETSPLLGGSNGRVKKGAGSGRSHSDTQFPQEHKYARILWCPSP